MLDCLTAFTAAAIAETPPMATGFAAWRIAKGLHIIPLLFVYTPILGGPWESGWAAALAVFAFALFGLYALAGALQGCLEAPLGWPRPRDPDPGGCGPALARAPHASACRPSYPGRGLGLEPQAGPDARS